VSGASATCEKYEVASGFLPVEHLELYIWLNGDELAFERSLALRRGTVLGKSCAGYQGKDSYPDLLTIYIPFIWSDVLAIEMRAVSKGEAESHLLG